MKNNNRRVKADLHTHSTASDGQYTPTELVAKAARAGIEVLAVTDHDTIAGVEEALRAGDAHNITVLRGVELSAREHASLHILGYCYTPEAAGLRELCLAMKRGREARKHRIVAFLRQQGVDISLREVEELAVGGSIGRPHFARVMVRKGYVATTREAFERYLDTDEFQKIERVKESAQSCIQVIRQAGGKAVLAHPYQMRLSEEELEALVAKLKAFGLAGIECYYPRHTRAMTRFYLELARRYGLLVTAGSDFHGEAVKPEVSLRPVELELERLAGGFMQGNSM